MKDFSKREKVNKTARSAGNREETKDKKKSRLQRLELSDKSA